MTAKSKTYGFRLKGRLRDRYETFKERQGFDSDTEALKSLVSTGVEIAESDQTFGDLRVELERERARANAAEGKVERLEEENGRLRSERDSLEWELNYRPPRANLRELAGASVFLGIVLLFTVVWYGPSPTGLVAEVVVISAGLLLLTGVVAGAVYILLVITRRVLSEETYTRYALGLMTWRLPGFEWRPINRLFNLPPADELEEHLSPGEAD